MKITQFEKKTFSKALTPFQSEEKVLKGTVSRDFRLLVFFMNQFPPSP
jgi:hypothetical protein